MGFARLARPANLPTAAADILAGITISLYFLNTEAATFFVESRFEVFLLVCSSVFLYAGGVVFNDVFDAELDAVERPERVIPSGLISVPQAILWGVLLMVSGLFMAYSTNVLSGNLALVLVAAILIYDGVAKRYSFWGPLVMGICRGLNLLLGMSILSQINPLWVALVPVLYIFAITLISRGEVHGNNKKHILISGLMYAIVILSITGAIIMFSDNLYSSLPFIILFSFLVFRPLSKAYKENSPANIKKAVMAGVLSLVVMDACWVAGFSNWYIALGVLLLLPLSLILSRIFAVT